MRRFHRLTAAVLVGAAAAALFRGPAHADGVTCTAFVAGVDAGAGTAPELVVWNNAPTAVTLDLTLRDASGEVLTSRVGEVALEAYQTRNVDLLEQIRRDLPKRTKPYQGFITVELSGAAPFSSTSGTVHVTQYYGSRKKPRTAYVIRPLYRDGT